MDDFADLDFMLATRERFRLQMWRLRFTTMQVSLFPPFELFVIIIIQFLLLSTHIFLTRPPIFFVFLYISI